MSKFNWDYFIGYDKLAMDADGCVYAFSGEIIYDEEEGVWIKKNPMSGKMLLLFEPAMEVLQGFVDPIERPDLPPDWWFEGQDKDAGYCYQDVVEKYNARHFNSSVEEVDSPKDLQYSSTYVAVVDWSSDHKEHEQYIGAPGSKPTWLGMAEARLQDNTYKILEQDWMQSHEAFMQHLGGKFLNFTGTNLPQDWTTNDTLDFGSTLYKTHAELAKEAIWAHFEEFECLPDFLVGDTEVLGPFFMGIKVIDDGEA